MSVSLRCYSTSLGCPKNRVDTERLLGSLGVALVPVESPDEAELVFINTCAFIQPATEESVRTIAQAIADIEELPKRPLLAVAGCLVGRYHAEDLAPELPEVDLWLDNSDLEAWPAMLARKSSIERVACALPRLMSLPAPCGALSFQSALPLPIQMSAPSRILMGMSSFYPFLAETAPLRRIMLSVSI